jgi:hypothetical protein
MTIWIRLIALVTGVYNFAIGGRAILSLLQVLIFAIGLNDIGLPLTTGRLVAGLGGIFLIVHSVRLIIGIQSAQRLQPWLCLSAVVSRLLIMPIQAWRFPQTVSALPKIAILILVAIAIFDVPLFFIFRSSRVRTAYAAAEVKRKERQEDRELQRSLKM